MEKHLNCESCDALKAERDLFEREYNRISDISSLQAREDALKAQNEKLRLAIAAAEQDLAYGRYQTAAEVLTDALAQSGGAK